MKPAPLDVAIVGAGIHGSLVAVKLLHQRPSLREGLRLIDPFGCCLAEWQRQTTGQGMDQMRSTAAHHLDAAPESLLCYAREHDLEADLLDPYRRPSFALFRGHCDEVLSRFRLEELVIPACVEAIERTSAGYRLELSHGEVEARTLVLAPGLYGHERIPEWAQWFVISMPDRVCHACDVAIGREALAGARVLVVGGGLSAATLAEAAMRRGARVTLVSRHPLEPKLFDADPGWVGPKYLRAFFAESVPQARLRMIARARGRASVTPELLERLADRRTQGLLDLLCGDEVVALRLEDRGLRAEFRKQETAQTFDRIWLATGFSPAIERLEWLSGLGPVLTHCGRPEISPSLELARHCFVSGWLAEIEIGPAARNIAGGRYAAARIAAAVARTPLGRPTAQEPHGQLGDPFRHFEHGVMTDALEDLDLAIR